MPKQPTKPDPRRALVGRCWAAVLAMHPPELFFPPGRGLTRDKLRQLSAQLDAQLAERAPGAYLPAVVTFDGAMINAHVAAAPSADFVRWRLFDPRGEA